MKIPLKNGKEPGLDLTVFKTVLCTVTLIIWTAKYVCLIKHVEIKNIEEVKIQLSTFLTSILHDCIWRCKHRASSCSVYITNKMHKFLWLDFIFNIRSTCYRLYQSIFRSSLFIAECRIWYVWLLCCYSNRTARHIRTYQIGHTAIKRLLLKMDWYSPKHAERILKIKSNNKKKIVHLVGYIYISRL